AIDGVVLQNGCSQRLRQCVQRGGLVTTKLSGQSSPTSLRRLGWQVSPPVLHAPTATTMPKQKKHSRVEIARKLAQASHLARQGKLQNEIARKLNVSVMTLHRWRKAPLGARPVHKAGQPDPTRRGTKLLNSSSKIHCCGDW